MNDELVKIAVDLLKANGYKVHDPQKPTKEEIAKIKDPAKLRKAIAENLELFVEE